MGRPLMPPDLLMRSTAICTPTSAVLPPAAATPDSGWSVPILYGFAWPNASRHGAGTSIEAPRAPAAVAPTPSSRRRVTLPLYQNDCTHASSFQFSAMARPPRRLGGRFRGRTERRGEDLDRAVDVVLAMGEGHVELLRRLHHAALEHRPCERGVPVAVGCEGGAVVGDGPVREIDLEHGRLARDLGGKARPAGGHRQRILEPGARGEEPRVRPRLPELGEGGEPGGGGGDGVAVERARLGD